MEHYMDKHYAVADHTILSYVGKDISLRIPERLGGITIRKLGSGAFMESEELQHVTVPHCVTSLEKRVFSDNKKLVSAVIPATIQTVGAGAFHNCKRLSELVLYNMVLEEQEYQNLKLSCIRGDKGIYVAREMPQWDILQQVIKSLGSVHAACRVPENVPRLFYSAQMESVGDKQFIYKNLNHISFCGGDPKPMTEHNAFMKLLSSDRKESALSVSSREMAATFLAEEANDKLLRLNKVPNYPKTVIFTFDDRETMDINGKKVITVTLRIGYFFWQSACKVNCDKRTYYIYRKYYLSHDKNIQYARKDVTVYTDDGIVKSDREALDVYAKYKFLCIL